MSGQFGQPTPRSERIAALDIIRGFALFAVLWMNLRAIGSEVPKTVLEQLPTVRADRFVTFIGTWVAAGKAQALFSISFGFGFAMLLHRTKASGANGAAIYCRRLAILFVAGVAHWLFLWFGDILNAYATMGVLLLLSRRWPNWALLAVALPVLLLTGPLLNWWTLIKFGSLTSTPWLAIVEQGAARRWEVFQTAHYSAYVRENFRFLWDEWYTQAAGAVYLGTIFARFLLGVWIYRQGWLQKAPQYRREFAICAPVLIVAGLLFSGIRPSITFFELDIMPQFQPLTRFLSGIGLLLLPLGYAAAITAWWQSGRASRFLASVGAVGQMALTNYVMHSLVFVFGLYGLGLGLLRYAGPTTCLLLAIAVFAAQVVFSRWWLARYRFGPLEWLWRSGTYAKWQPLRLSRTINALSGGVPETT